MLLIKNGRVLTMEGTILPQGCVLIKGGKIKRVAPTIDETNLPRDHILDAQGGWIMPGLIESHCHIGITEANKGTAGDDCNESTGPVTPALRALDAVNPLDRAFEEAARAGITSCMVGPGSANVVGGQFLFMKTMGDGSMESRVVLEPAAMKVAFGENPKNTYGINGNVPATRMAIAGLLREELTRARQYLQRKWTAAENREAFETDHTLDCWEPVFRGRIPLKAHVHRADDILTAVRIAREFGLSMTLDHCSEGHIIPEEIQASGFPAIVGPSLSFHNKVEMQYTDFRTPGVLHRAGVQVAITTDHPVTLIQTLPICAGFAAREGLGVEEGLRAITINAARICRVEHRVGSLAPGKDGDVAVFTGNPMEVFTKSLFTIIDGRLVYAHDGRNLEKS